MKLSKLGVVFATACAMLLGSCASNKVSDSDPNVKAGVSAWNFRGPSAATAYWSEIEDSAKKKKWLNYVTLFEAGKEALETTDEVKASNEAKLLSLTNTALNKFSALDPALKIPGNVCEKGNNVTAARIDKLLAAGRLSEAKKMGKTAVSVYGTNSAMKTALAEIAVVEVIQTKKNSLLSQAEKAGEKENFDEKIAAFDAVIAKYPAVEAEVNAAVEGSTVSDEDGVVAAAKAFKKVRQDIRIQRSAAFRDEAYSYKDRMGEEFARQPEEGSGTGKNGAFTIYDTKKHYEQIGQNMDNIYAEIEAGLKKVFPNKKERIANHQKVYATFMSNNSRWYNKDYLTNTLNRLGEEIRTVDSSYQTPTVAASGGCYVATAVYGSYDCPQVWTLRRYRDYTIAGSWYGRAFIRTYYAISPILVKWFGHTEWFKKMCQGKLDRMVADLQAQGVESTPYEDKEW